MTPEQHEEDPCSDSCTRNVCEWCPEADRQAAVVEQFKIELHMEEPPTIEVGTPVYGQTPNGEPITLYVTHVAEDGTVTIEVTP